MRKKLQLALLTLGIITVLSGCGAKEDSKSTMDNSTSNDTVAIEEIKNDKSGEVSFEYNASEENVRLYEIGYDQVVEYFGFIPDRNMFSDDNIIDMEGYADVVYLNENGSISVSIAYEDDHVFAINAENYKIHLFAAENKDYIKNVDNIIQIEEYMYSLKPTTEEEARNAVEKYIEETELSHLGLEFRGMDSEDLINSQDKEYYVFEYEYKNDNGLGKIVSIKYQNFIDSVVSVNK